MKVLIPGVPYNPNLFSPIAEIFCHAKAFLLFDCEEENFFSYDNLLYETPNINIGTYLRKLGVDVVICNRICKSCYRSLQNAGINIWHDNQASSMREACQSFMLERLKPLKVPLDFNMHTI